MRCLSTGSGGEAGERMPGTWQEEGDDGAGIDGQEEVTACSTSSTPTGISGLDRPSVSGGGVSSIGGSLRTKGFLGSFGEYEFEGVWGEVP